MIRTMIRSSGVLKGWVTQKGFIAQSCHPRFRMLSSKSVVSDLASALANEIAGEENNDDIDQEFVDLQKQILANFSVKEEPGNSKVTLFRSTKAEKLTIQFNVQDVEEDDGELEDMDLENEADLDQEPSPALKFEATLSKGEEKLIFYCVAAKYLRVENIQILPPGKEATDVDLYNGPIFDDLDEELRNALKDYLAERKVDDDLSYFILNFARRKEQKEYLNWLNQTLSFVEK